MKIFIVSGIFGFLLSVLCWPNLEGRRTGHEIPPDAGHPRPPAYWSGEALDFPPRGRLLGPEEVSRLQDASHRVSKAVLCVGYPGYSFGSGFVISKNARLIATSAHVARIIEEKGVLYCRKLGLDHKYAVSRVWYHPLLKASLEATTVIADIGKSPSISGVPSLDVAIVRLDRSGPELPQECALADAPIDERLLSEGVGVVYCSNDWLGGRKPVLGTAFGSVDRSSRFSVKGADERRAWGLIDVSVKLQDGSSGSPVFLPNGDVVAIWTWGWTGRESGIALDVSIIREIARLNKIDISN